MNTENNKLIAEFMGYKLARCSNGLAWESPHQKAIDDFFHIHGRLWREDDPYYKWHTDWNWLMQVVEKIEKIDNGIYDVNILPDGTIVVDWTENNKMVVSYTAGDYDILSKINGTYNAVIEFIKWYNLDKVIYQGKIVTLDEMVKDLRARKCDENNELSDEYLINEAHQLGEWEEL